MDESRTTKIEYCPVIYTELLTQEAGTDTVIPDTMPDVVRILCCQESILLQSKTVSDGGVTLDAMISHTVLYTGEDRPGICRLEVSTPVRFTARNELIESSDACTAALYLSGSEARTLNPRKIQLRVSASAAVTVYRKATLDFSEDAELPDDVQKLYATENVGYIAGVTEKSFTVSEELHTEAAWGDDAKILTWKWSVSELDSKKVGGKLIVQGMMDVDVLLVSDTRPESKESFRVPFSQIMDLPGEDCSSTLFCCLPTAGYLDTLMGAEGNIVLTVEMSCLLQAVFTASAEIRCLEDAYSVSAPTALTRETLELSGPYRDTERSVSVHETASLPEAAEEIVWTAAELSPPFLREGSVYVNATVRAILKTVSGELSSVSRTAQAVLPDVTETCFWTVPECGDLRIDCSGENAELHCTVSLKLREGSAVDLAPVKTVTVLESDGEEEDRPSLVAVRADGRSLWELAKSYRSAVDLIRRTNPDWDGSEPQMLLIPRADQRFL